VIETMVLLNEAETFAMPEVTFLEPLALRTLMANNSSLRRSSAVTAASARRLRVQRVWQAAEPERRRAVAAVAGLAALGALAGLASATGGVVSAARAFLGAFSFLGADFSSAMEVSG
jgi:hypothetical protein